MTYQHIQIPSDGERITINVDSSLNSPDNLIIPYISGDGTGIDIIPVMRQIVDAALEKAYGSQKRMAWMEGAKKVSCSGFGKAVVASM